MPYQAIEEVHVTFPDKRVLVRLKGPVVVHPDALLKAEEYFTYEIDPKVDVDPGTFQVTLDFGPDKRLRNRLKKQYFNDHI